MVYIFAGLSLSPVSVRLRVVGERGFRGVWLIIKVYLQVVLLSKLSSSLILTSVNLRSSWKEVISVSRIFLISSTWCLFTIQYLEWVLFRHL